MSAKDRHFDIDASIVFQLGEGLISDSVQALVELIKNSWDADGSYARVTVNTKESPSEPGSYFADSKGYILIEDDGVGMDEGELINGWLLISDSPKREQKARGGKTGKQRTPLGEKGLGRLGVQRLGDNIEIITEKKDADDRYHVGWSWNDFRGKKKLSDLRPQWKSTAATGKKGTKLLITGLQNIATWEDQETLDRFKIRLSQMISPYAELPEFAIKGRINERKLELADISEKIRSLATLRYLIDFDAGTMSVSGRMRLDYIRPPWRTRNAEEEQREFEDLVADDDGKAFFEFLLSKKAAPRYQLVRESKPGWFCGYSASFRLDDIDKVELANGTAVSPGPFHAEMDNFNLEDDERSVFAGQQQYKQYVKNFGGIRVFRDGFGVRTDEDWLGLGKAFTGGGSFYALRPANVMGFVAITAEKNKALVEATDREGFIDTSAYRNFVLLFQAFARFAGEAQEFVRRGYREYKGQTARVRAQVPETASPDMVARMIVTNVSRASALRLQIDDLERNTVGPALREVASLNTTLRSTPGPSEISEIRSRVAGIHRALESTATQLRHAQSELEELCKMTGQAKLLQQQVETLQYQMKEASSTISLGLTAEALSHEVANVADRLADKTSDISKYLSRANVTDERIIAFSEHVRSTVNALRKQMAHLAPSLKFARERRYRIDVCKFLESLRVYHNERWTEGDVSMSVRGEGEDFSVRMNEGKLTQVIDNLVLNSEYWVREAMRQRKVDHGLISVRCNSPYIRISDNGPGIDPHIEPVLFQPFNTSRKNGRGLGLYIVKQLLESDDCSITVSPRRNAAGRLYQFVIDLSGVLDGDGR